MREAMVAFKFERRGGLGQTALLGGLMLMAYERSFGGLEPPELIVPVPLHPRRLAWRGYNQSLELARPLARNLGVALLPQALSRRRDTPPQVRMATRAARRENPKGAFVAAPELVEDRELLLVDDIMTTGSTVEEAVRALRRAGAAAVDVLVVARA